MAQPTPKSNDTDGIQPSSDLDRALDMFAALGSTSTVDPDDLTVLVVDGEPYSKARPRFAHGRAYASAKQRHAEDALRWRLKAAFRSQSRGNVAVACVFFRRTRQRVDVDNMVKHVLDAANGIVWEDDSQVTALMAVVEMDRAQPRTVIAVGPHSSSMDRRLGPAQATCATCGATITYSRSQPRPRRYCNSACVARARGQDLRAPVPCSHCATPFRRRNSYQHLCSAECRKAWMRERRQRNAVPPNTCDDCGELVPNRSAKRCRSCWRTARSKGEA